MLASSLYGLFESIFIGKFLGTTAFAAFGMAFPLIILNFALAELVGVGSSVPISIFLGQKKDDKANNYFVCSILLTIITGFISGLALYFGSPFALSLMGAKGELLTLAVSYLRICAVFSPITPLMFCLDNYLRISGKVKTSMSMNVVFSVITVLLELLFIKVFKWGIEGAALGTNISMTICVVWGLVMFIPGKLQLKFVSPKFSFGMFKQIYKNGIAPFLTNISGRFFNIIMNIMLLKFGSEEGVAIYGVIMTLAGMVEQLLYGIIDSLQPAIGYNYGAKQYKRVTKLEKYILSTAAAISLSGGAIMFFIPHIIAVPFLEDLSLLPLAVFAIKITSCTFIIRWLGTAIQLFFMALEKPMRAMIISISSACVFPLILIPTLYSLKLTGLWWNYP
ncbi:MAG: MATE family efflux transporter, partial [Clostridia bacterium]|nr:MATE family efflux transporter [Clostridia bacterium]